MQIFAPPRVNSVSLFDVLLNHEGTLAELLGEMIAHAGFGLVLVTIDRQIVYANDAAETLMRAGSGLCR
ncbi:MAG: hypothetical protein L0Y57_07920, partial [Beijerinckiaceae bacterium]|nr:hypothetical protein [Beijerinckiaceae bacterium]